MEDMRKESVSQLGRWGKNHKLRPFNISIPLGQQRRFVLAGLLLMMILQGIADH